jgi:hypothetical protein
MDNDVLVLALSLTLCAVLMDSNFNRVIPEWARIP